MLHWEILMCRWMGATSVIVEVTVSIVELDTLLIVSYVQKHSSTAS